MNKAKNENITEQVTPSAVNPGMGFIQVSGIPSGNRLLIGKTMQLTVLNASNLNITSSCTWEYDRTVFNMQMTSGKAEFTARKSSTGTTIRAIRPGG